MFTLFHSQISKVLLGTVTILCLGWGFIQAANESENIKSRFVETEVLGGEERYQTALSTDKPIYKPGDTLRVRGVVLHHSKHTPLPENQVSSGTLEVLGPKGDVVASGWVQTQESVFGYQWIIPEGQIGGEYTLKLSPTGRGDAPVIRTFDIRNYRPPQLTTQIEFMRKGLGAGDTAVATLNVKRVDGDIPKDAKVTIIARIDGKEAFRGESKVDAEGNCVARFALPDVIDRGEGTLAMRIEDGGIIETASKTIPILLQTVDLTMYPEGGDLVADVPNTVYWEAFTPAMQPADLSGFVVNQEGKEIVPFKSSHEGRGKFTFEPVKGEKYALKITEPSGINSQYDLPEMKETGAVIHAEQHTFPAGEALSLQVSGSSDLKVVAVTLSQKEKHLAEQTVDLSEQKTHDVSFEIGEEIHGVLIATLWSAEGTPLAERLIYREPAHALNISIHANKAEYVPGEEVELTIETRDAQNKPVSAMVGLNVTDDSLLEMIETRDQAPRLPVMVMLENEVNDLADAQVYLDSENEEAPLALDLLLGTQGWRRFAYVNTTKFIEEHGDDARRTLALRMISVRELKKGMVRGFGARFAEGAEEEAELLEKAVDVLELAMDEDNALVEPEAPLAPGQEAPPQANAAPVLANELLDRNEPEVPAETAPEKEKETRDRQLANNGKNAEPAPKPAPPEDDSDKDQVQEAAQEAPRASVVMEKRLEMQRALQKEAKREAGDGFGGFLADEALEVQQQIRNDFVLVREYAHPVKERADGNRTDFTETIFWAAALKTDEQGIAKVTFGLSDSVTTFKVFADGFDKQGALGSATKGLIAVEPFYVEPKLPLEVTSGDYIYVPIVAANKTDAGIGSVAMNVSTTGWKEINQDFPEFALQADQSSRRLMGVKVGKFTGDVAFTIAATAGSFSDKVTREMTVQPLGFPIEDAAGGLLQANSSVSHEIVIPESVVPGSISTQVLVYPTPLASMTAALERLIREPYGCFEQTSSSTYPLVMAQQYFMTHEGVSPTLIEKSDKMLAKGYQRLIGFESPSGGFEWFGGDPGHDSLTAYGLMEFSDMSEVREVDPVMLERTRDWLLNQRDGKGGFERKTNTLHTWLPNPELSSTYNTWALLQAGETSDLTTEVDFIRDVAEKTQNTYVIALAANVVSQAGDIDGRNRLLDKLAGKQEEDGSLKGATTSVVGSGGEALAIETTALAALAWLNDPKFTQNTEQAIKFLAEKCEAGRFGSTQSTILALKAIVAYDISRAHPKAPGRLTLWIDGKQHGDHVDFTADDHGSIVLPDFTKLLTPGKHTVEIKMEDGSQMPYSVAVNYHSIKPASSEECKLTLDVSLSDTLIKEGEPTEAMVKVSNRTNEKIPTPVAIIGIPGGLEVRHKQLKELVEAKQISAYEVRGREVILYWRAMEPAQEVDLQLSLTAAIPGTFTGPASRAYLYYTDEHKQWNDGLMIDIEPIKK